MLCSTALRANGTNPSGASIASTAESLPRANALDGASPPVVTSRSSGSVRCRRPSVADRGDRPSRLRPRANALACADRKSTRLNSSHLVISYAVFCLKKKKKYNKLKFQLKIKKQTKK